MSFHALRTRLSQVYVQYLLTAFSNPEGHNVDTYNNMASNLSPQQASALFDILTHHQAYHEIQRYRYPNAIENYGPPFAIDDAKTSDSPILQTLLYRFVLTLPGLKDISPDFWQKRVEDLVRKFGEAELSESYDKGTIGSRRTLATAIATLIEYPARGVLGGIPKRTIDRGENDYDLSDPEDVRQGWDDFLQDLVYGDLISQLEKKIGETDKLEEQSMRVQAAHEYILVNLASFLHYIMILSPDGPYLVRVLENVHKLVPYAMMRQTLRVGNAATMINGMLKLLLTKMTVNSVTSFFGLTNYSDAGMNMLQQIASTVIGWDISELKKQTTNAEKAKDAPPKEHLEAIKNHMKDERSERDARREKSEQDSKSIVQAIFDDRDVKKKLSDQQHDKAMDFFSIQLSINDRQQLSRILCSLQPDIVTQAIRDMVAAYDPIIRQCHNAIDLSGTLFDFENFLTDLIKISKGCEVAPSATAAGISRPSTPRLLSRPGTPKPNTPGRKSAEENRRPLPSVDDYIKLLRKHQSASHRFLHQAVKNDKTLADKWVTYARDSVAQFRRADESSKGDGGGAGDMTSAMQDMFSKLPDEQKKIVLDTLDSYTAYSMALTSTSQDKWNAFGSSSSNASSGTTSAGPGIYLAKWQYLLDNTKITPATASGPVRSGRDKSVREKVGVGVETSNVGGAAVRAKDDIPEPPDVSKVIDALSEPFKDVIAERGKEVWQKSK